ncbi:Alpha/beta hydrolase fold-3 domain-containing protein [Penicillium ucsense]|uniref:Alpha/beta hydrolase fold-3 domain-containing protein n=1 Tax=Penicillium ucsense TaxID=2839758 RepID=A0A8J8WII6_9EURO|nr:Alpha/beta hydrolase fold-3 domain-containing protein [Penicillium ucsense]KAF7730359.1 Alpha/beta hydrolase fold-3 domain-containing protein [Penicillium ucsense]
MADVKSTDQVPQLGFWEKVDLPLGQATVLVHSLFAAITGLFRGQGSPKVFSHHVTAAAIRTMVDRLSVRQAQYMSPTTPQSYHAVVKRRGLQPEVVELPHDTEGYWMGKKSAKNVIIYYHGGGFAMAATAAHFDFWIDLIQVLNDQGHDIAVFFPRYTLAPQATYPTQLRQAVGALRYILADEGRDPSTVIVGGDSAGGNLAMALLLHLSHPHPEIDQINLSAALAGVFAFAPWVNFDQDWPSYKTNAYKDIITGRVLSEWSNAYLDGKPGDNWSEPSRAPAEWWKDAKTERILFLAGSDEILLGPIEDFAKKIKSVFPHTTFVVGDDESHDAHLYVAAGSKEGTQTSRELRRWVAARL